MGAEREVPADIAAVGQAVLKPDNVYRQVGEHFDASFPVESAFAAMYDTQGRGAIPPLLAALVTVFQMLEKVPDRQAAEFVASRLDWKYALHLPLAYPGFTSPICGPSANGCGSMRQNGCSSSSCWRTLRRWG